MVRKIETWEASDGSHHKTKLDALECETILVLSRLAENEAIARRIVAGLVPNVAEELSDLLGEYVEEARHANG